MRRSKTLTLGEVLRDYIREMNLESKLNETGLINSWEEIVGKAISSRTSRIYIKDRILYVHLNSPAAKSELLMLKQALREKLNEKAGQEVIKDIIFR